MQHSNWASGLGSLTAHNTVTECQATLPAHVDPQTNKIAVAFGVYHSQLAQT